MATDAEDRFQATDMWIRNHPVQLTTVQDKIKLHSKATVAFQSMPKTGASRWVVSAPGHVDTNTLLQVIKKIAKDTSQEDRVLTLH